MVRLQAAIKDINDYTLAVGWFDDKAYLSGIKVSYVAQLMEFGVPSRGIPERATMRPTIAAQDSKWAAYFGSYASKIAKGEADTHMAFEALGIMASSDLATSIATLRDPKLSPITLLLRKWKKEHPGGTVTGALVGEMAAEVRSGKYDVSGVPDQPLNDSGLLYASVTYRVGRK